MLRDRDTEIKQQNKKIFSWFKYCRELEYKPKREVEMKMCGNDSIYLEKQDRWEWKPTTSAGGLITCRQRKPKLRTCYTSKTHFSLKLICLIQRSQQSLKLCSNLQSQQSRDFKDEWDIKTGDVYSDQAEKIRYRETTLTCQCRRWKHVKMQKEPRYSITVSPDERKSLVMPV